jgi:transposase-like protein
MADSRRKFDEDSKQGAVRLVHGTGKPIAQVRSRVRGQRGTLGN